MIFPNPTDKIDCRTIGLEPLWKSILIAEFQKDYLHQLKLFLQAEKKAGKVIFPPGNEMFSAFNLTPFDQVKVVIIGQDPYHGANQAHGLCFSVKPGNRIPPSLQNIYKEIESDLAIPKPNHGYLNHWAQQGVLMLNAVLSVEKSKPASHNNKGWEIFTDKVIEALNEKKQHLVFLLWGSYAEKKGAFIDRRKHQIFCSPHPSPFSAHRGFLGNRHFSQTNAYLTEHGISPIDWKIPNQP